MGIVTSRRGAGTFIVEGPPQLSKTPLQFLAALHTTGLSLRDAETHRRIYEAVRSRAPERARREMSAHLEHAVTEQVERETGEVHGPAARRC
jgi:DNA-binding FadR family transcriptional regulator